MSWISAAWLIWTHLRVLPPRIISSYDVNWHEAYSLTAYDEILHKEENFQELIHKYPWVKFLQSCMYQSLLKSDASSVQFMKKETMYKECAYWTKYLWYSSMVRDEHLEVGTKNWSSTGTCIHSHLYKIIYMHKLNQSDYAARMHSCSWLLQNVPLQSIKVGVRCAASTFKLFISELQNVS